MDIVIGIVPDEMDDDGPYNPFKSIWAEANIPSQMVSVKTARLFERGKAEGNKRSITYTIFYWGFLERQEVFHGL